MFYKNVILFLSNRTEVYSCDLHCKDYHNSPHINASSITNLIAVPGLLFVHTIHGLSLLDPCTLNPVEIKDLVSESSVSDQDQDPVAERKFSYQFEVEEPVFNLLRVWDDDCVASKKEIPKSSDEPSKSPSAGKPCTNTGNSGADSAKLDSSQGNFGNCLVGFSVNNRLVVMSTGSG